ncbi:MAG: peptide chain release factor N(5)-glutamine methyltransferase [Verrucomicrobia bacterium]|nr:peptide chain release factor N(5)-glutamine methyltransferase [Verrucomicrobiota bacterium]
MRSLKEIYEKVCEGIWFYSKDEAREIAFLLLQKLWGISRTDLLVGETDRQADSLEFYIERINQGEPVQYILGEAWFMNRSFAVNPSVLIPRPETEEMVSRVSSLTPKTILDLGTGCGCISVTLALEIPEARVFAIDISDHALTTAESNALAHGAQVTFAPANMLDFENPFPADTFDLIISNPPYVKENEKPEMRKNVLDFEPHLALFVPDQDPLVFYRHIAETGLQHLAPGGAIWVEINSYLGEETAAVFRERGYSHVRLLKDFFGKERFLEIKK